jgi:hypothetical protein
MTSFKKGRPTKPSLQNRLVITWFNPDFNYGRADRPFNVERDSFKATSEEKAKTILSKRVKKHIMCAKFYDKLGLESVLVSNKRQ